MIFTPLPPSIIAVLRIPFDPLPSDVFLVGVMGSGITLLTQIAHGLRSNGNMDFEDLGYRCDLPLGCGFSSSPLGWHVYTCLGPRESQPKPVKVRICDDCILGSGLVDPRYWHAYRCKVCQRMNQKTPQNLINWCPKWWFGNYISGFKYLYVGIYFLESKWVSTWDISRHPK